ncbi:enoyl-CoA delta isomerase 2, peroxisomal [Coffea arabica]|uniref:Delta(3)-Delta(2)-enoyl-CoA isomerase n=1 Tax=Coffea arabica TaxID=13443 RepID=A0A6P6WP85_COFAR|nr:enoyl-CoA delta isomerase 2, peroxisomal-like [Coffea arabica]
MCTLEKRGNIFLLTLTGDDEHRLNPTLIASIRSALAEVKSQATKGSVLITSGQGKFFSNGFHLRYAQAAGSVQGAKDRLMNMVQIFKPLVADLISLPMPTIAAITGHAAAAGLMLALSHDYITMRSDKGVLYMSELDIGMTLPDYFNAIFRSKIGSPSARRALLLRASKVRAEEAAGMGIIDSVHSNGMETLEAAVRLGEDLSKKKWEGKVYAEIRKSLYPELCGILGLKDEKVLPSRL